MKANYYQYISMVFGIFLISSCSSDNVPPTMSSVLNLKASSVSSKSVSDNATINGFTLENFLVNISDIIIEENSGNDQEGDHQDGGNEKDDKNDNGIESEDITLSGPYSLDLSAGSANVDQVAVYPGTFKKVDFTFLPTNNTDFAGNSILLNGTYTNSDGSSSTVSLKSAFSKPIQIALPDNGITVLDNSSVTFSILLDASNLMSNVDLSSATIVDGSIIIDTDHNAGLLNQFQTALEKLVEVED